MSKIKNPGPHMVVTQGFFILFDSGIVVCAGVEAGMLVHSEAGWMVHGAAATPA